MQWKLFSYTLKKVRHRFYYELFVILLLGSLFIYPLYRIEYYQNKLNVTATGRNPVNAELIKPIEKIEGVRYVIGLSFSIISVNNKTALVVKASQYFGIFISKYILHGRLPRSDSEVLVADISMDGNFHVGDSITINENKLVVVGVFSSGILTMFKGLALSQISLVLIVLVQKCPDFVQNVIIGLHVFSDVNKTLSEVYAYLKTINFTTITLPFDPKMVINNLRSSFILLIFASMGVIIVFYTRQKNELALLYAVGWSWSEILTRIVFEFLILIIFSYVLSFVLSYFLVSVLSNLYFFYDIIIPIYGLSFMFQVLSCLISGKVVLRNVVEGLN
ncbi:MAG: hypothetical protein ACP6IS_08385 [Candidatus Asgardarchaeia archaeon]